MNRNLQDHYIRISTVVELDTGKAPAFTGTVNACLPELERLEGRIN